MKFIILIALVAFASAAPVSEEIEEKKEEIAILRSEQTQSEDGSYNFGYEGSDGSGREESADITDKGTDDEALEITGSYRYIDANGEEVVVNYTAGKNGFVPVGSIIAKEISEVAEAAKDLPQQNQYEESSREDALSPPRKQ